MAVREIEMFRLLSVASILIFGSVFLCGCGCAGAEKGGGNPVTMDYGGSYDDLAKSPEKTELNGIKVKLEAEVEKAFDPTSFVIRIKTEEAIPEGKAMNIRSQVSILSGGKTFDATLIRPFVTGPHGTALVGGVTVNADVSVPEPADFVVRLSDDTGETRYLRSGSANIRWRNPDEYMDYAGGNFEGSVAAPKEITSHGLMPIRNDFSGCSSSLATLLKFTYGENITEIMVMNGMITHGDIRMIQEKKAFSLLDMKQYLKSIGYTGTGFTETEPVSFQTFTEDGMDGMAPVIMGVDYKGYKHFILLRGYDEKRVYIGDPAIGNVSMTFDELSASMVRMEDGSWMTFVVSQSASK